MADQGLTSNRAFARRCGFADDKGVREWLSGKREPQADSLRSIATATNVSLDWLLLGGSQEPVYRSLGRAKGTLADDLDAYLGQELNRGRDRWLRRVSGSLDWMRKELGRKRREKMRGSTTSTHPRRQCHWMYSYPHHTPSVSPTKVGRG